MPNVRLSRVYFASRIGLAAIFFYHGLVPKILFADDTEIEMNEVFMPFVGEKFALISSGILEIIFAILLLVLFRNRILNYLIIFFGIGATLAILIKLPHLLTDAFNPFSTNLAIVLFALINLWTQERNENANKNS